MKKFQYTFFIAQGGLPDLNDRLNSRGREGWEAIHIQYKNEGVFETYYVILKREKNECNS